MIRRNKEKKMCECVELHKHDGFIAESLSKETSLVVCDAYLKSVLSHFDWTNVPDYRCVMFIFQLPSHCVKTRQPDPLFIKEEDAAFCMIPEKHRDLFRGHDSRTTIPVVCRFHYGKSTAEWISAAKIVKRKKN